MQRASGQWVSQTFLPGEETFPIIKLFMLAARLTYYFAYKSATLVYAVDIDNKTVYST